MEYKTMYKCKGACGGISQAAKNCGDKNCDKFNQPLETIDWHEELSPEQYRVLRECGTEAPFTGEYWTTKDKGMYLCAACGAELFSSDTKYDSGSGWPSFWKPFDEKNVEKKPDASLGIKRTEAVCSRCGGHLGHVFTDGPKPTGLRYCINSVALKMKKK